MFSNVLSSTAADPEVWIRLVTSRNSRIQVMLYQEDDPELDDEWLTAYDTEREPARRRGWNGGWG